MIVEVHIKSKQPEKTAKHIADYCKKKFGNLVTVSIKELPEERNSNLHPVFMDIVNGISGGIK